MAWFSSRGLTSVPVRSSLLIKGLTVDEHEPLISAHAPEYTGWHACESMKGLYNYAINKIILISCVSTIFWMLILIRTRVISTEELFVLFNHFDIWSCNQGSWQKITTQISHRTIWLVNNSMQLYLHFVCCLSIFF